LHRFGDFVRFLVLLAPLLFHPNFGVFPLHQIALVGVSPSRSLKLFGSEIIFEYSNLCENHTSTSQTDKQTTYCRITALCVASRGKNVVFTVSVRLSVSRPAQCFST